MHLHRHKMVVEIIIKMTTYQSAITFKLLKLNITRHRRACNCGSAVLMILTLKASELNFHPLVVVSSYRDPQLEVGKKITYICLNWEQPFANVDD